MSKQKTDGIEERALTRALLARLEHPQPDWKAIASIAGSLAYKTKKIAKEQAIAEVDAGLERVRARLVKRGFAG